MSDNSAPAWALNFARRIARNGLSGDSAFVDVVSSVAGPFPAVFVRLLPGMTFEGGKLTAVRAITEAQWTFAKAAGNNGVILSSMELASRPEYVLSEAADGVIINSWINARAFDNYATFARVKNEAQEAAEEYRKAILAGVWPKVQYELKRNPAKPSYCVNTLTTDANSPIRQLLLRKNIE